MEKTNNDSMAGRPRFSATHPLYGIDLPTLCRVLSRYGPAEWPGGKLCIAAAFSSAILRLPFTLLEKGMMKRGNASDALPFKPVFILGHWRSGTTHLYNLLSRSSQFGYATPIETGLPWEFLTLGRFFRPLLKATIPRNRRIDNIPVNPDSPQEDEIALANMTSRSYYHGIYFPGHIRAVFDEHLFFEGCNEENKKEWEAAFVLYLRKLSRANPGKRLLLKNPAHSARVDILVKLFPDARFIHIYRHPYEVIRSTRNFYKKLLPWLALQSYSEVDIDTLTIEVYVTMMKKLAEETAKLQSGQFMEVRFEEFEKDPMVHLREMYETLELGSFGKEREYFEKYLDAISGYKKNVYEFDEKLNERVYREARFVFDHWGFDREMGSS